MSIETILGCGKNIRDKDTHYELHTIVGPYPATIVIPGYIAREFKIKYKQEITETEKLIFKTYFIPESQLVAECRDPYKLPNHRRAIIKNLDEISLLK